jgi:phosphohistidine phosphatase
MQLYLVRHGIAENRDFPGIISDAARRLTPEGERKMRRNSRALLRLGVELNEIWTSPLVRARQTAEILAEELMSETPVHIVQPLKPDGQFEDLLVLLQEHQQLAGVALVGHEPFLGELAAVLIGAPRPVTITFKKGGVANIEIDQFEQPLQGALNWLLTPRQMRLMTP